ncbi:MAG: ABC transporter permease [Coprobacillus sp.]|nr:ABC transporter permease [Coprobacillus sp.]
MFKDNKGRMALIICIIAVSLLLCSGLGVTTSAMEKSYNEGIQQENVSDFLLKSTEDTGFKEDTVNSLIDNESDLIAYEAYFSADYTITLDTKEKINARFYDGKLQNREVNTLALEEGRYPASSSECLINKPNGYLINYQVGDVITFNNFMYESLGLNVSMSLEVVGIVSSPLYSSFVDEPMLTENMGSELEEIEDYLDVIIYTDSEYDAFNLFGNIPVNEIALRYNEDVSIFHRDYKKLINTKTESLNETLSELEGENYALLTFSDNVGFIYFDSVNDKIDLIAIILPIFFMLVCALVISITTSRLVNDERGIIGCYNSLGISRGRIISKYFLFNLMVIMIGALVGIVGGIFLLPAIIHPAYSQIFNMGPLMFSGNIWLGLLFSFILLVVVLAICLWVILANLKESPASLLLPKAPKAGKKIFLERWKGLWKRLSFSIKSMIRNIFRYKKNMILTILSVMGSGALVVLGFGLFDNARALTDDPLYGTVSQPIAVISIFVLILAALLCILVLFNLVNMNISERKRELCTLKVLGYHDTECLLYTSREIITLSVVGALLAVPLGWLVTMLVCNLMDFGSASNVTWTSYILSLVIMIVCALISNLLLYPKTKKLDMNESLKSVE